MNISTSNIFYIPYTYGATATTTINIPTSYTVTTGIKHKDCSRCFKPFSISRCKQKFCSCCGIWANDILLSANNDKISYVW